jgi:hypothetical protein
VRWAVERFPEIKGRIIVVSRGGTHHWLEEVECDYVDLLSIYTPEELVSRRASLKDRAIDDFTFEIFDRVKRECGLDRADLLHPSLLYNSFYRVLKKADPYAYAASVHGGEGIAARYRRLTAPDEGALAGRLPEEYVAARFYFRPSLEDSPEHRDYLASVLALLAGEIPVVLLNTRMELDDHVDLDALPESGVTTIDRAMTPADNLHVQTIAISRARAFVGTYGGLAYLPPFFGIPSIGLLADEGGIRPWHHALALSVFDHPGWGSLSQMMLPEASPEAVVAATLHTARNRVPAG